MLAEVEPEITIAPLESTAMDDGLVYALSSPGGERGEVIGMVQFGYSHVRPPPPKYVENTI